jgi:hypothetical protein
MNKLTLDNILKVSLAVAVGVLLYKIFFHKSETYYNYQLDQSGYAYPSDYEDDVVDDYPEEVIDASEFADGGDMYSDDIVVDDRDMVYSDDGVVDDSEDDAMFEYDDAGQPYDDSVGQIPASLYEEADEEDDINLNNAYEFLYAAGVQDDMSRNSNAREEFILYSNMVGVDADYQ